MYVDGVPVLRNASSVGGMMAADFMPWIIGTSTWETEPDHGWYGCVGETRIVDHALTTSQFLYNRVNIADSFAVTTDFGAVYAPDQQLTEVTGTGLPGSGVRIADADGTLGSAEVGEDGSWTVTLSTPVGGPGAHPLTITPSFGTRDGAAQEVVYLVGVTDQWRPSDSELTADLENAITVAPNPFAPGDTVTITLPAGHEGDAVYVFAFSEPTALGSATVSGAARITMVTPSSLPLGAHRIAVYAADGTLLGWQSVTVATATPAAAPPSARGHRRQARGRRDLAPGPREQVALVEAGSAAGAGGLPARAAMPVGDVTGGAHADPGREFCRCLAVVRGPAHIAEVSRDRFPARPMACCRAGEGVRHLVQQRLVVGVIIVAGREIPGHRDALAGEVTEARAPLRVVETERPLRAQVHREQGLGPVANAVQLGHDDSVSRASDTGRSAGDCRAGLGPPALGGVDREKSRLELVVGG